MEAFMKHMNPCTVKLPRADTPESVGVDSNVIYEYLNAVETSGFRFDSLMIYRNGKVAGEFYWHPYTAEDVHDMYSFSKTVTATAVGFAVDEGLLSLDSKVYSFFPEKYAKLKGKAKQYADELTVHSLLTMRSGKKINMFNDTAAMDWTDNYMDAPFSKAPNKKWEYVSENIYMLAKIITIVSGVSVVEFLTPRLFEPLEMGIPEWLGDHDGVEAGGWGLRMSTEQMAKFTLLYLQNGKWGDKQILSESWMKACQSCYVDKLPCIIHDGTYYGYQTWLNDNPKYTRLDGLYGQISVVFPDYNGFILFNANDTREFEYIKQIFDYFPRAFVDNVAEKSKQENEAFKNAKNRATKDVLPPSGRNPQVEKTVNGKKIILSKARDNASVLGAASFFMWSKKPGKAEYFKFDFDGEYPVMKWKEQNSPENAVKLGMNGDFIYSDAELADVKFRMAAQGQWEGDTLKINLHPVGFTQHRTMAFSFKGNKAKIISKGNMDIGHLFRFYMYFSGVKSNKFFDFLIVNGIRIANEIWFDPNLTGRLEK